LNFFYEQRKANFKMFKIAIFIALCFITANAHGLVPFRSFNQDEPSTGLVTDQTPVELTTSADNDERDPCFIGNTEVPYCKNGGRCYTSFLLNRPQCICPVRYTGDRCENLKEITGPESSTSTVPPTTTTDEGKVTRPGKFTTRPEEQTTTLKTTTTTEAESTTTPSDKRDPCFIGNTDIPYCKNGGKCYTTLFLNRPQCLCPLRFSGDRCEDTKDFTRPGRFTTEPTTTTTEEGGINLDHLAIQVIERMIDRKLNKLKREFEREIEAVQEDIYEQEEDINDVEEKLVELKLNSAEEKRCPGVVVGDSCYFLGKHQYDYDTAVLDCRSHDAELAEIKNLRSLMSVHSYMLSADHITDRSGLFVWTGLVNEVKS